MLTLITATLIGAYLSRRCHHHIEDGIVSTTLDYQKIWQDGTVCFARLCSACLWLIAFSRHVRTYCDLALLPWLERRGIAVILPTIDLPRMPQAGETCLLSDVEPSPAASSIV